MQAGAVNALQNRCRKGTFCMEFVSVREQQTVSVSAMSDV